MADVEKLKFGTTTYDLRDAGAARDNSVVHKTGNETINGNKTFNGEIYIGSGTTIDDSLNVEGGITAGTSSTFNEIDMNSTNIINVGYIESESDSSIYITAGETIDLCPRGIVAIHSSLDMDGNDIININSITSGASTIYFYKSLVPGLGRDYIIDTSSTDGNIIIAPTFSTSKTYAVGDYVLRSGVGYKCTTAHSAGAWNSSHFTRCVNLIASTNDIIGKTFEATGSDYAEKFETLEDCPVCRFVTLDGEKIKLAQPKDDYILGITSELPSIIGDKMNQGTPVGLLGKLWVECDDTVKVNSFVTSGKDGIATKSDKGYRVMAVDGNKCKVLVK